MNNEKKNSNSNIEGIEGYAVNYNKFNPTKRPSPSHIIEKKKIEYRLLNTNISKESNENS